MKFFFLVWENLWRKRTRSILTLLSIVVAFLLFASLNGVLAGFERLVEGMSAERLSVQNRGNMMAGLPLAYLGQLEALPGVRGVAYMQVLAATYRKPCNVVSVGAVDVERYLDVNDNFVLPAAQRAAVSGLRTGALAGRDLAAQCGWKLGDRLTLHVLGLRQSDGSDALAFDIVGIYDNKLGSSDLLIRYDYFDAARTFGNGSVTLFLAQVADAAHAAALSQRIDSLFASSSSPTRTQSQRDWMRGQLRRIGNLGLFVSAIMEAVLFTILLLTAIVMMQSVRERATEFGVLKACGYGAGLLVALVVGEALLLCLAGSLGGIALAASFFPRIFASMGLAAFPLPWSVGAAACAIAACLALVSGLLPALSAARLSPVDALAGRRRW